MNNFGWLSIMTYLTLFTFLPWIPGCWRPLIIRNTVLIKYALLITRVLLYALQGTIWSLLEVSFCKWHLIGYNWRRLIMSTTIDFFFPYMCQNPCGIYQCMITAAYDTSKDINKGLKMIFLCINFFSLQKCFC